MSLVAKRFHVVQPWGKNVATENRPLSARTNSAVDAFGEIDRMADQMLRTFRASGPSSPIVIDDNR
jgi:hypothetical protein